MKAWRCIVLVALAACGLTDSDLVTLRIGVNLGQLQQGDYTTVAEQIALRVTSDGEEQSQSLVLGEGEFEATFDVAVKTGSTLFSADVVSNNGTLLYTGSTTTDIEDDGFVVTIVPSAVNAVLVLAPRVGTFTRTLESDSRQYVAHMIIRNRGSATLTWRADSLVNLPSGVTTKCELPNTDGLSCSVTRTTGPGLEQAIDLFVDVDFDFPQPASVTLRILSPVGTLLVPAVLPPPPIG